MADTAHGTPTWLIVQFLEQKEQQTGICQGKDAVSTGLLSPFTPAGQERCMSRDRWPASGLPTGQSCGLGLVNVEL